MQRVAEWRGSWRAASRLHLMKHSMTAGTKSLVFWSAGRNSQSSSVRLAGGQTSIQLTLSMQEPRSFRRHRPKRSERSFYTS